MKITQVDNGPVTIILEDNLEYLALYFGVANFADSISRLDSALLKELKFIAAEITENIDEETTQIGKEEEKNELVQD